MPASAIDSVDAALQASLSKNLKENNLSEQLVASTKKVLLENIEFESAGNYHVSVLTKLKSKYIVLQNSESPSTCSKKDDSGESDTLRLPKVELFPLESVQLGWDNAKDWSVGCGMVNMGYTCYLNSTLQALFHTPAFVNWLVSDKEHAGCQGNGIICLICAMKKTLLDSQQRNVNAIRPLLIYNKLRIICRHFEIEHQEDAHEFLRYLVEGMEKAFLSRFRNHSEFDSKTKETTPLNQILGGYLRSAVNCLQCGHVSTTFQHFQDLLLDIRKPQTVDEALESYFAKEKLDDESYQCESCCKKVLATKQFSLERAPMVLCIQLKRFSGSNTKISKHISFRQRLDLTKYARYRPSIPLIYKLVALVTHMGPTVNCGHYTAVGLSPSGNYYQFDDSTVRPISHQAVFNTNAYIMFYELEFSPYSNTNVGSALTKSKSLETMGNFTSTSNNGSSKSHVNGIGFTSSKVYGPQLPPELNKPKLSNGIGLSSTSVTNGISKKNDILNNSPNSGSDSDDSDKKRESFANNKTTENSNGINSTKETQSIFKNNRLVQQNSLSGKNEPDKKKEVAFLSNSCQTSSKHNKDKPASNATSITRLVPYDMDDSSNSEDSGLTSSETNKVSASNGEWKVTSTVEPIICETSSFSTCAQATDSWHPSTKKNSSGSINKKLENRSNGEVVRELVKMSHSGYSTSVSTWNGTRALLDKEVANEKREERKRTLVDLANSSDQGRVKHVKTHHDHYKSNPDYNPIQEYHNAKNWNQNNNQRYYGKSFYNGKNRYNRRNFHLKNNCHGKHFRFK